MNNSTPSGLARLWYWKYNGFGD